MMSEAQHSARLALLVAWLALAGCAPASAPGGGGGPQPSAPAPPSVVTIAIGGEVDSLASKLGGGDTFGEEFNFLTSSPLVVLDGASAPHPLVAAELPSRDAGTWVVNADGTMTTTWRIRPNAAWHDGQPVTARDFAFTFSIYSHPNLPVSPREPERFMESIDPIDDKTFVIRWSRPYPWANQLISRQLDPLLPEHVMGRIYNPASPDAFPSNPIWLRDQFVGNGPYVMAEWVRGSQMTYRAFDRYFVGRPKLDTVVIRIIEDTNTVVANLLSGTVDVTVGVTLGQIAGAQIKEQWARTGEGQVLITPVRFRYMEFQHNPAHNRQPAILDPRGRKAVAHALDRAALAEVTTAGTSPLADIFIPPADRLFQTALRAVTTYRYEPTRAAELLRELGWTRQGNALVNSTGMPLTLEIRTTTGSDNESEAAIISADLNKAGIQVTQNVLSEAAQRDNEYRTTFPGVNLTARSISIPEIMGLWITRQCPNPQQNFTGANRGCWQNQPYENLFTTASSSLDERERDSALIDGLKLLTDQVGVLGLSYNSENLAVKKGLVGPTPRASQQRGNTWNIHEWRWES